MVTEINDLDEALAAARVYVALPPTRHGQVSGPRDDFLRLCPIPEGFWTCVTELEAAATVETADGAQSSFAGQSLADVAAEVAAEGPPKWLFQGAVVAGDYGILAAEKKAWKSWAALDAAIACATGMPWLGHYPSQTGGPVILFYGEGGKRKFMRRAYAVGAAKGLSRAQVIALPIFPEFSAPQLGNPGDLELIRQAIAHRRPALVIVDPLYLSAGAAKGSDLYAMGALLGRIQRIVQEAGCTLLVAHHWNKGGTGDGHDRASGVGPAEWGRFLISIGVKSLRTDHVTKETSALLKVSIAGDEVAAEDTVFWRRVRAENPDDLESPLHYDIALDVFGDEGDEDGYSPAESKILEAMLSDRALTIAEITDRIAAKHGHGLRRTTVSAALNKLAKTGVVDQVGTSGTAMAKTWLLNSP
ncbi:AAA family ATPase [Streptomyces sp. NPDC055085]